MQHSKWTGRGLGNQWAHKISAPICYPKAMCQVKIVMRSAGRNEQSNNVSPCVHANTSPTDVAQKPHQGGLLGRNVARLLSPLNHVQRNAILHAAAALSCQSVLRHGAVAYPLGLGMHA